MTDRTQFEAMLEALINEDQETAKEIFHNIVVAKSREIYEELLSEDFDLEEGENPFASKDDEEDTETDTDDSEADDSEDDSEDDVGGDASDDFIDDVTDGEEEGEEGEGEEGDQEARIMDLEDALEELKAEFEQLMAGEEGEEHMGGMDDMGADDMGGMGPDELGAGDEVEDEMMGMNSVMEYTRKVSLPKHGDNGTNAKSIVAGKNDMGGTSANMTKNFSTEKGGTEGGLASPKAGDLTSGLGKIHNRKDSNSGKTAFKKSEPGHGAEKKGKPEQSDKSAGSLLNGVKSRAK
jgi:hypothetical protein